MEKDIEELLKKTFTKLKPGECSIFYDEKRGVIVGVCNRKGEPKPFKKKVEEL